MEFKNRVLFLVVWFSVFLSFDNRNGEAEKSNVWFDSLSGSKLVNKQDYDFYGSNCPEAENIIITTMTQIYSEYKDVSAGLLRLMFHDCFIRDCDTSILLDDSHGNQSHNRTLKGFDKTAMIKEVLEKACPGMVSCADIILVLATRDGIILERTANLVKTYASDDGSTFRADYASGSLEWI